MPTAYLTADELAELIGHASTDFACMRRYLKRDAWAFEPNLRLFPRVSRASHETRLRGVTVPGPRWMQAQNLISVCFRNDQKKKSVTACRPPI